MRQLTQDEHVAIHRTDLRIARAVRHDETRAARRARRRALATAALGGVMGAALRLLHPRRVGAS